MTCYCIHPHCSDTCFACSGALTEGEVQALRRASGAGVQAKPGRHHDKAVEALTRLTRLGHLAQAGDTYTLTPGGMLVACSLADSDADTTAAYDAAYMLKAPN